jgi:DNA repair protein RecO (recombination protein O)
VSRPHARATFESSGLLLGRVAFGESDLIVQLFTDTHGLLSALARGARKSTKRFSGSLEPIHTLSVELSETPRGDLHTLAGAQLHTPRTFLTSQLDSLTAAGHALMWIRRVAPEHVPEPQLWRGITLLLDAMNQPLAKGDAEALLCGFGLRLLEVLGWGLTLTRCVSCGKDCPDARAAWVNPERGGLVCRTCGGGPLRVSGSTREEMRRAAQEDQVPVPGALSAEVLRIVDRALGAHVGMTSTQPRSLGSAQK